MSFVSKEFSQFTRFWQCYI